MSNRVFLAGAGGVIGRRLLPLLRRLGFDVVGTTRSSERAQEIERLGGRAVIVDAYDRDALVAAAQSAGARRLIAQSIAWVYQPGSEPHSDNDPIDPNAHGVADLEQAVLGARDIEGIVLRYGWFYGPGANAEPAGRPGVHIDAAAYATVLAIDRGSPGTYNIAEPRPTLSIAKATRELGWDHGFRAEA